MYVDALLLFSDAQAITAAAGSESTIDLGAVRDIGTGEPLYIVVCVDVAMTDAGSDSSVTVALEGDSTDSFSPDGTQDLFVIPAVSAVGATFFACLNPGSAPLQYRYIRLKYTPNNGDLTTGSFTAFIAKDIQKYRSYAKGYTIS
jgi:hypothetical protein